MSDTESLPRNAYVRRLTIQNFRGIQHGTVNFIGHTLLVGGNNSGKSTVCEALDLVLGPERLFKRPIVNEHDFCRGHYLDSEGKPIEIRIEAILLGLSEETRLRFNRHLRRWNDNDGGRFADEDNSGPSAGDEEGTCWALQVIFIARYASSDDDFVGQTFFAHPIREIDEEDGAENELGPGLTKFTREHKRLCGFLYLRALRTGSRALSLQRGSLLDTVLRLGETGSQEMWLDTLKKLHDLKPPIGEIEQLKKIRKEIKSRVQSFVNLAPGEDSTAFFASNLTRDDLRDVVRFFVASEQSGYLVPFQSLGTGSINMLVFALLTFVADLKSKDGVIFAMEEPEIALPPHTQRRVVNFVLNEMGQAIVTSHSPYIIEQFEPNQIIMLERTNYGLLTSRPIDTSEIKPRKFKFERRQFAEAILSRAVLVVEGHTESFVFPAASSVIEKSSGTNEYMHIDLAGISIFNAGGSGNVPHYGPIFKSLGKLSFGFYDKTKNHLTEEAKDNLDHYTKHWESPYEGAERLLVEEIAPEVLRRFLEDVNDRYDYPTGVRKFQASMKEPEVKTLAFEVLKARKAEGYGALLIEQCQDTDELPKTIYSILAEIHQLLVPTPPQSEGNSEENTDN